MFDTSLDVLYMSLAIGFILLVIFICVTLIYMTLILRDVNKITDSVKDTAEKINGYVLKPAMLAASIAERIAPIVHGIMEKTKKEVKKRK